MMKMNYPFRRKFTLESINYLSSEARQRASDYIKKVEHFREDTQAQRRVAAQECKTCFYVLGGRLVGQAFTEYDCAACGVEQSWHNTGVPQLCKACAEKYQLCINCMGDINMQERTYLYKAEE